MRCTGLCLEASLYNAQDRRHVDGHDDEFANIKPQLCLEAALFGAREPQRSAGRRHAGGHDDDDDAKAKPGDGRAMVALRLVRACPGATISANAVGVFYRGIFLRAEPMYTAEWYTAPTFMHIDATHEVNSVRPIHEDAGRQLEHVIHRLASKMTPPCSIDTTHEGANSGIHLPHRRAR